MRCTRKTQHPPTTKFAGALIALFAGVLIVAACEPVPPTEPAPVISTPVPAANGDIGWEGQSFDGASGSPSGSKPESKLWYNDGAWWADMWDTASGDFYVHKLDLVTHQWVKTSTRLDDRTNARSDSLWDGTHLFVASHAFAEGSSSTAAAPSYLRRFSYSAATGTYTLDPGFPVQINNAKSETLVIDEDSQGRIWATWMQSKKIMVAVSTAGGGSWGAPFALPVAGATTSSDDIASVLAYGGNKIGILWSNEDEDKMYFVTHLDGDPATTWGAREIAYQGTDAADDHINLKNVADQNGRILAAVKTSQSGSSPLVHLLDRSASGTWTSHVFGLGSNNHTWPIVLIDSEHGIVHMFATSSQSGGSIYRKTAPLSNIDFPTGKGTAVLTDADNADINNATSTKQAVNSTTGLVVLATNDSTRRYWTHYDPIGGTGPGTTTTSTSTSTTTSTSTSTTTSTTSTTIDPTSSTSSTSSTTTSTTLPPATPVTFTATADAPVKSTSATKNYGTLADLRTRSADPAYRAYLRFDPSGLSAPAKAVLRLYVTDASKSAGTVSSTSNSWAESTITYANAPGAVVPALRTIGATTAAGTWIELDVTSAVTGNGQVSFVLTGTGTDSAIFNSRETATKPQLVITPSGGLP